LTVPPTLPDLTLFLAVAERLSFARVAIERGLSRSAVSHSIRALEEQLDVRLFNRTTRSVTLTEIGAALFERIGPAIDTIATAIEAIDAFRHEPRGTLRLNMSRGAASLMEPLIAPFLTAYPQVRLEIVTNDAFVDIVRDGFDAGIRFGEQLAGDMIAVPFGGAERYAVVATQDYFGRHRPPLEPADLVGHNCIGRRFPGGALYAWEFEKAERSLSVQVDGRTVFDDNGLILKAARAGLGLALVFEDEAMHFVKDGSLVRVLEDWCPPFPGYHLYYSSRRQMPMTLRAFIDFSRAMLV
jgi:DNA-binding transcriptional LysR family regulator